MMKQVAIILASFLFLQACNRKAYLFTSFNEPADKGLRMLYSLDGRNWSDMDTVLLRPAVGSQQVMRDPSMVQGPDGRFHLVWTSSWRGDKGFGYAASNDLLHWTPQQFIPVMQHEPTTVNVWAPELFYDEDSKRYIIVWASCIPGRFAKGIEADSNNHRLYYTTTPDFKDFTATKLFYDPGFSSIDAVIVKKKPADYVLVLKDNTRPERNIRVAFSNNPLGPWENLSSTFTAQFTEGPAVVKLQDEWLIYYDAYQQKIYGAASTKDFKQFLDATTKVSLPSGHKHGTILETNRSFIRQLLRKLK